MDNSIICDIIIGTACSSFFCFLIFQVNKIKEKQKVLRSDLDLVMRNPSAAKRLLNKRK